MWSMSRWKGSILFVVEDWERELRKGSEMRVLVRCWNRLRI
jgi:hypothetical protein